MPAEPPASRTKGHARRRRLLGRRSLSSWLELAIFGEVPLLLSAFLLIHSVPTMVDFRVFWDTGRAVLAGGGGGFAYPAPAALALAPFGLLPYTLAAAIFGVAAIAAVPFSLRLVGVRDWRCYGAACLTSAMLSVIIAGALSSFLLLGAALAWRYRDRTRAAAVVVAAAVVAKILLWPLLLWLVATRRLRAALLGSGALVVAVLAGWAVTGFASLLDYPSVLARMASGFESQGYSSVAVGLALGLNPTEARAAAMLLTALLVIGIFVVARRADGDRRAFSLAIVTALAATPIVWLHYFVLLLVPIALARPRLAGLWLLPLGFWACTNGSDGHVVRILSGVSVAVLIAALTLRPQRRSGSGGAQIVAAPHSRFASTAPAAAR